MPPRYFRWYLVFWHVIYLGVLGFLWVTTLWDARAHLGWRELALTGLALGQVLLYVRYLILADGWPFPRSHLLTYFLGSLVCWYFEWQLAPNFFWLIYSFSGQMFGLLPPIAALPSTAIVFAFIVLQDANWDFSKVGVGSVVGVSAAWISFSILFLYVYNIARTSHERGRLINELRAAHQELEAARQRDSELAVLRERERVARDLHDSLGHALVALSVQLEAVQRLYKVDPERASAQVDELKTLTRNSMDDLRRSLEGLRAPGLGERPLREALQNLCVETSQRLNLTIDCHVDEGVNSLTPAVAETIWRVTQEALTNIGRHAQAHHVNVAVALQNGTADLSVTDDGVGLPANAEGRPGHYGLRGIRERVEGLGGSLNFKNGQGVTLEVKLPVIVAAPTV